MDLSDFMNVTNIENNNDTLTPIVTSLTDFIQHIRGEFRKIRKIVYSGPYTCPTKSALDNDLHFLDDLLSNQLKNVGPNANYDDNYLNVWLFYRSVGKEKESDTQMVQEWNKK